MKEKPTNQEKYLKSEKGKRAVRRARTKYDEKDPEKRKEQKRNYMRRMRKKDPTKWR